MSIGFRGRSWGLVVAGLLLFAVHSASAQMDATLVKAQGLIDAGRAQAAYDLLAPEADRRAGNPGFDYLFALAAIDSGRVTEGVFALERVLAADPDQPQARAELARAYMLLGELDNARAEFEAVKRLDPPPEVQATIDRYLAELDRRQGREQKTFVRGFLAATVGYDSNVNSAQDANQLNVPLFAALSPTGDGTAQIGVTGIERSDSFGQVAGGVSVSHRIGPQMALLANGAVALRWNQSERRFDTYDGRADLGVTWQRGRDVFTVAAQGNRFLLDRDQFRDALGAYGQWRRTLDASTTATGYVQATMLTYDQQRIRNANRYTVGGVLTRKLQGTYSPTVTLGLYGGEERERASNVEHLGHRFVGVAASGTYELQPKLSGYVNAMLESRYYGGTDPFFLVDRDDTHYRAGGGLIWGFAKSWSLLPAVSYTRNDSNVDLNEYDRLIVSMTLRRNFE